jgi:hypothetical protein
MMLLFVAGRAGAVDAPLCVFAQAMPIIGRKDAAVFAFLVTRAT